MTTSARFRVHCGLLTLSHVFLCLGVSGCEGERPYRIGVVLDRSGTDGARMAAARINRDGGVRGHRIELRSLGSLPASTAELARATAELLAADPTVLAVIGHTNSAASLAAAVVYNGRHLLQIAPTAT